jgi:hypothetical protein
MGSHDPFGHLQHKLWQKKKVEKQIDKLIPDHGKSEVDPIPLRVGGVRHAIGKLWMKATTSIQTSSRSKVCTRSYSPTKLRDSQPWRFQHSHLGVLGQKKPFGCHYCGEVQNILYGGRWCLPPNPGHGESCESKVVHGSFQHQRCYNLVLTNLFLGFVQVYVSE